MKEIYCDNGSTSFPKAPGLGAAIGKHIDASGYNISRGGYSKAYSLEAQIIETREAVCRLFHCKENVIFTPGATIGLNMILKGLLKNGDHVITTSMEHNAVVRPLAQLEKAGVLWSRAQCDDKGRLATEEVKRLIRPQTKLILAIHASNVCGTLIPIKEIGTLCRDKNILFCVDASQTAGGAIIDAREYHADALVFPGHKALLGPQGIGVILLSKKMAGKMEPLFSGGTGSASEDQEMPGFLPDKFQPGTLNIPGIIGLKHALGFIEREGLAAMIEKKRFLTETFVEEVSNIKGAKLIGLPEGNAVSLDFAAWDNAEVALILEKEFGVMTRCGLHCAPHAHQSVGTFPQGTVRFSFGYFNTITEVKCVAEALSRILSE